MMPILLPPRRILASLLLVILLPACSRPISIWSDGVRVGRNPPTKRPTAPETADDRSHPRVGWMLVVAKEPPSTLVAADGSRCTVTAERFENVKVGERALCAWAAG